MWNFHVWRTLVWPLCNGSEWWWYLWKGNLSLFWTNQTRLLSLAWFWSCGRMKKKKWDFDHLPEMTLCTVQRSPRGKQNYFSYGPFNGLSDPHTFVPARHTFQICRLNHIAPLGIPGPQAPAIAGSQVFYGLSYGKNNPKFSCETPN